MGSVKTFEDEFGTHTYDIPPYGGGSGQKPPRSPQAYNSGTSAGVGAGAGMSPWGLLGQGIQDTLNFGFNWYWNDKNYNNQQAQQAYERELQQTIFDREDNAVQRRVADLKAAGLNPVLAAGSAAQAGQAISLTTPQRQGQTLGSMAAMELMRSQADIARTKAETAFVNANTRAVDENLRLRSRGLDLEERRIDVQEAQFNRSMEAQLRQIGINQSTLDLHRKQASEAAFLARRYYDLADSRETSEAALRNARRDYSVAAEAFMRTHQNIQDYAYRRMSSVPAELQRVLDAGQDFVDTLLRAGGSYTPSTFSGNSRR